MADFMSRILVSLGLAIFVMTPIAYVARRAIEVLVPLLGEWTIMNATPQVEWAAAGIITLLLYTAPLSIIWNNFWRSAQGNE
jgi:hypothetical protein